MIYKHQSLYNYYVKEHSKVRAKKAMTMKYIHFPASDAQKRKEGWKPLPLNTLDPCLLLVDILGSAIWNRMAKQYDGLSSDIRDNTPVKDFIKQAYRFMIEADWLLHNNADLLENYREIVEENVCLILYA